MAPKKEVLPVYRIDELQNKEVIDACRAIRLGYVADVEFSEESGAICALIVPGRGRSWFTRGEDLHIPWHSIERIGEELIIVRLHGQVEIPPAQEEPAAIIPLPSPPASRKKKGLFGDF
ncbi:MAG: YlmC/YmxH family sporulation protein [Clostridia bacterium]|nr:YlmC/YmxH family sporulation protein [Clostridia bacterium]